MPKEATSRARRSAEEISVVKVASYAALLRSALALLDAKMRTPPVVHTSAPLGRRIITLTAVGVGCFMAGQHSRELRAQARKLADQKPWQRLTHHDESPETRHTSHRRDPVTA